MQGLLVELEAESENHPQEHVPTNLNIDLSQALHVSADVNSTLPADFADATGGVYHPTSPTNEPSQSSENASDTTNLPDDNNSDEFPELVALNFPESARPSWPGNPPQAETLRKTLCEPTREHNTPVKEMTNEPSLRDLLRVINHLNASVTQLQQQVNDPPTLTENRVPMATSQSPELTNATFPIQQVASNPTFIVQQQQTPRRLDTPRNIIYVAKIN